MPRPQRVTRPTDLLDWGVVHDQVYDLAPEWQQPRPDVAGFRSREEVEVLRSGLMAGRPFRQDALAPRVLTDRGQRIAERFWFAEVARAWGRRLASSRPGIVAAIVGGLFLLGLIGNLGSAATTTSLLLMIAFPIMVAVVVRLIARETLHPALVVVALRPEERVVVRDVRHAVHQITTSRAFREGYLEAHRARVDLNATADALTRRVIEISQVRSQVGTLSGPVRRSAEEALRGVVASMQTQVRALQSYSRHVRQLDRHLRDADSAVAAVPVFDAIGGLMASTVEDELDAPRLHETGQMTQTLAESIARMTAEAAADLDVLVGANNSRRPA